MGIDDRVVTAMEPGVRHSIDSLSSRLALDYAKTLFSLERLAGFGFVEVDHDERYKLTAIGIRLRKILSSRD